MIKEMSKSDNVYLDEYTGDIGNKWNAAYFKIQLWKGKVTVTCMQYFDEPDYDGVDFFTDKNGHYVAFYDEANAIEFVNKTFKRKHIQQEYLLPKQIPNNPIFNELTR